MENTATTNRRATPEQLMLVNILNTMYNDNIRQLNHYHSRINYIMESNNRIRDILIQILFSNTYDGNGVSSSNPMLVPPHYIIDIPLTQETRRSRRRSNGNAIAELIQTFLDPVEVHPIPSQIEAATRRVRYADILQPRNTQCPISMENFSDNDIVTMIRFCGHIFHTESLTHWFASNSRCPVCRFDIRDFNTPGSFYDISFNQVQPIDFSGNNASTSTDVLWNLFRNTTFNR